MKTVNLTLTEGEKTIEYMFDLDNQTYTSLSRKNNPETGEIDVTVSENGPLGSQQERQVIARRIYYVLLTTLKAE